jgi:hypothetical protein
MAIPTRDASFPLWPFLLLFGFGVGFPIVLAHPRIHAAVQAWNDRLGGDQTIQGILDFAPYFRVYLLVMVVATSVLAGTTLILCLAAVAQAAVTRRSALVFISYHHDLVATVETLRLSLERAGCVVVWIPFASAAEHDALLDRIYDGIRGCDFLICFPGGQPSFVEAEVAVAIGLHKPIIIVLPTNHTGAPNTSHKSYPALVLEKLQDQEFGPLVSFIRYLHGDWRATLELIKLGTDPPGWATAPLMAIIALEFGLLIAGFVAIFVLSVVNLGSFDVFGLTSVIDRLFTLIWFGGFYLIVTVALLAVPIFLLGSVSAIGYRLRAMLIVRRRVKQGTYSYELLRPLLVRTRAMSPILESVFMSPPFAHHEGPIIESS